MRLPAVLGFAIAAVVSLPAAAAVNAPAGRIAFSMGGQTHEDIYVVNADGGGLFRLTDDPAADFDPSWSPDGRRIAYRHEDERSGQIYVMNADGSGQQNLTRRRGLDYSPAWSPDGRRIAFGSVRNGRAAIWVMRTDGSGRKQLSSVYGEYPAWSPDGKKIAFDHISGSDWDIWVMNADGSGARPLIATAASEQGPRVVAGGKDDRLRVRPGLVVECSAHLARGRRRQAPASPHRATRRAPGLVGRRRSVHGLRDRRRATKRRRCHEHSSTWSTDAGRLDALTAVS